jgi:hypothetical protein
MVETRLLIAKPEFLNGCAFGVFRLKFADKVDRSSYADKSIGCDKNKGLPSVGNARSKIPRLPSSLCECAAVPCTPTTGE